MTALPSWKSRTPAPARFGTLSSRASTQKNARHLRNYCALPTPCVVRGTPNRTSGSLTVISIPGRACDAFSAPEFAHEVALICAVPVTNLARQCVMRGRERGGTPLSVSSMRAVLLPSHAPPTSPVALPLPAAPVAHTAAVPMVPVLDGAWRSAPMTLGEKRGLAKGEASVSISCRRRISGPSSRPQHHWVLFHRHQDHRHLCRDRDCRCRLDRRWTALECSSQGGGAHPRSCSGCFCRACPAKRWADYPLGPCYDRSAYPSAALCPRCACRCPRCACRCPRCACRCSRLSVRLSLPSVRLSVRLSLSRSMLR